jgi:hypothetical protein
MIRFYKSKSASENMVIEAAYEGCPVEKELTTLEDYRPSQVAVVMGVYKHRVPLSYPRGEIIKQQRDRALDYIVLETGYINRGAGPDNHYAFGWNGLNGRADFRNKGMPGDRAAKLDEVMQPWRDDGDYVLLCGQVPWDASCDFEDHVPWLNRAVAEIDRNTHRKIIFRPHPLARIPPLEGCAYSQLDLQDDLEDAWCVVNFNSNSGVDSIMAGIPVFTFDVGSMVYSVSRHDWEIEAPVMPDRQQWLNDIAYAQWTPDELRSGEAWQHILRTTST